MCAKDNCNYIVARVAAHEVPSYLVVGWNSSLLIGEFSGTLGEFIECSYKDYVVGCGEAPVKPVEMWMQDCSKVWDEVWVDRRVSDTDEFVSVTRNKQ
jgi:hypothetical protein